MSNIVQLPFFKFPLGSFMSDLLAFLLPFLPVIWTRCPLQGEGGVKERAGADTWVKIKHSSCQMSLLWPCQGLGSLQLVLQSYCWFFLSLGSTSNSPVPFFAEGEFPFLPVWEDVCISSSSRACQIHFYNQNLLMHQLLFLVQYVSTAKLVLL